MPRFDKRLLAGSVLVLVVIAINAIIGQRNTIKLNEDASWVIHTHDVLNSLDGLLSAMKDAETGQRGFLITGDERYLAPYNSALAVVNAKMAELRQLTKDNPRQQRRLPPLQQLISAKMDELSLTIDLRRRDGFEAAKKHVSSNEGKIRMDAIRAVVAQMESDEQQLLVDRERANQRAYRTALVTQSITVIFAVAAVLALMWLMQRSLAERQKATAVIYEQREWLRTTLASIGDAVIATDTDGRLTFLNPIAETLTGWKEADAIGRPIEEVFVIVNEETRRSVENPIVRTLAEGMIVGLANHTILVAKDGTERPIDDSAAPIRDATGRIRGGVLVFRDITARKAIDAELREQAALLDLAHEAIIVRDTGGTITFWSTGAEEIYGWSREQAVGKTTHALLRTEFPQPLATIESELAQAGWWNGVLRHIRMDGTPIFVASRWALRREEGKPLIVLEIDQDITARKQAEDGLREADRRKDEFLATLAHELRNPLAPLLLGTELLRRAEGDADLINEATSVMERQVRTMMRLVDDLMDMSRIARGKVELRREIVDLAAVLRAAAETCRPLIDAWRHQLTVSVPEEPLRLYADATRLTQVFSNVLTNAAKYTEAGGSIHVHAERVGPFAVVSVRDTGIGISPEMLPRIFDMYTQADRGMERAHGGLGIGLSLVKRLVELHGGTVEAHSEGPGRGSDFVVRLPLHVEADEPEKATEQTGIKAVAPPRRVLIVDDNEDSANTLATLLAQSGNETRVAYDGIEALTAAEQFRPDAVLLDIALPKLDGFEICRRIREQPWGTNLLLVAISGRAKDMDTPKTKDAGFNAYLVKPVDFDRLVNLLASFLIR